MNIGKSLHYQTNGREGHMESNVWYLFLDFLLMAVDIFSVPLVAVVVFFFFFLFLGDGPLNSLVLLQD